MRYPDWQMRYDVAIRAASDVTFEWGVHDCVTFAANVYDAVCDGDAALRMRDQFFWSGPVSAARMLKELGGLRSACERILGPADEAWLKLGKGDLIIAINPDGEEILTVHDGYKLLAPGPVGLIGLPLRTALCGWSV